MGGNKHAPSVLPGKSERSPMRDKTKNAIPKHLAALKSTDRYILLGDSHCERLVWKHPELAPLDTWICAVGGDSATRLMWRVKNEEGTGYVDAPGIDNAFEQIIILIGGNDLKTFAMKQDDLEEIASVIEKMTVILKERWSAKIIVLPLLPPPSHSEKNASNYERTNDILTKRNLVTKQVDWKDLTDEDYIDHGHLNVAGYRKFLSKLTKFGLKCPEKANVVHKKTFVERRIAMLQKKLERIKMIKEAMAKKETVELTQIDLVSRQGVIEKELQELKEW